MGVCCNVKVLVVFFNVVLRLSVLGFAMRLFWASLLLLRRDIERNAVGTPWSWEGIGGVLARRRRESAFQNIFHPHNDSFSQGHDDAS